MNNVVTELERTLLTLCEIPSSTGEEGPLCDYVEELCVGALGRASVKRDGHSLVVCPEANRQEQSSVLLVGHLDCVRTVHDGPPRVEGERLYGAGAADMKSGLAVMLHLIRGLAGAGRMEFAPTFVFYEREEGPYLENRLGEILGAFASLSRAELAVCLEPSSNALQLGCMGSLHARVRFKGRTAHSARPWQGDNAIYKSVGLIQRLCSLGPREVTIDNMLYREVTSATLAEGGRGRNVVPDLFTLNLNMRFAPDRRVDEAVAVLEALVAGEAEVEVFDKSPAARPFRDNSWVKKLEALGVAGVEPKQAWTDVARFAQAGVAAVNLGPGTQSQAHQQNEWTDRAALTFGMQLFRRWMFGCVLVCMALVSSCSGSPPRYPMTDPAMALGSVRAREARVRSLRAQGSADHFGVQGRIRGSVYIFVERPRNLRVDTHAFGSTLSSLISDGETFTLTDYRSNHFFTGPAVSCVASQLLGIPLEAAEVVSVMAGGPPVLDGTHRIRWDDGHYVVDITGSGGRAEALSLEITRAERQGALPREQHPLPSRAELRDSRGVRAVITFEDYTVVSGVSFPRRVRVVMERDNVDLLVRYREIEINPELPESAWRSSAPEGMTTVPVECEQGDAGAADAAVDAAGE